MLFMLLISKTYGWRIYTSFAAWQRRAIRFAHWSQVRRSSGIVEAVSASSTSRRNSARLAAMSHGLMVRRACCASRSSSGCHASSSASRTISESSSAICAKRSASANCSFAGFATVTVATLATVRPFPPSSVAKVAGVAVANFPACFSRSLDSRLKASPPPAPDSP